MQPGPSISTNEIKSANWDFSVCYSAILLSVTHLYFTMKLDRTLEGINATSITPQATPSAPPPLQ